MQYRIKIVGIVHSSMSPKGVEHHRITWHVGGDSAVHSSMSPKGVEHAEAAGQDVADF